MKLGGRDIKGGELLEALEARLRARGLLPAPLRDDEPLDEGVEPRVDPLSFNLSAFCHSLATFFLPRFP